MNAVEEGAHGLADVAGDFVECRRVTGAIRVFTPPRTALVSRRFGGPRAHRESPKPAWNSFQEGLKGPGTAIQIRRNAYRRAPSTPRSRKHSLAASSVAWRGVKPRGWRPWVSPRAIAPPCRVADAVDDPCRWLTHPRSQRKERPGRALFHRLAGNGWLTLTSAGRRGHRRRHRSGAHPAAWPGSP